MATSAIPSVVAEEVRFVENGAGVYTGSIVLPAYATLLDVVVHAEALWTAGTSATMIVGDAVDDDGIFTAVNLKATDLLAGESISFTRAGGKQGADLAHDYTSVATIGASQSNRRFLGTERSITGKITSVGAGTAGRTRMVVIFARPSSVQVTQ